MQQITFISDFLINGFIISTSLFLLAYLFIKSQRKTLRKFISISNIFLLSGACLHLIFSMAQFQAGILSIDQNQISYYESRLLGPYWFAYYGKILSRGFLPQILWFKKLRNFWVSLLLLPFLLFDFFSPILMRFRHYDFLPASYRMPSLNYFTLFANGFLYFILLMITFFILKKLYLIAEKSKIETKKF